MTTVTSVPDGGGGVPGLVTITEPPSLPPSAVTVLRVVYIKGDNVCLWTEGTGSSQLTAAGGAGTPMLSGDGLVVAFIRSGELRAVNADASNERLLVSAAFFSGLATDGNTAEVKDHGWMPGIHTIYFNTLVVSAVVGYRIPQVDLYSVNADAGTDAVTPQEGSGSGGVPYFSPDGTVVALAQPDKIIFKEVALIFSRKVSRGRLLTFVFGVLAIGLACTCNGLTVIPQSPTSIPQEPPTPVRQEFPTPVRQEFPTPVPQAGQGLEPTGPWLLISASDGLWATNPDGSNLVQLTQWEFGQDDLAGAVQPGGNLVVLLTSAGDRYHHLALNLLSLPDGQIQKITDLTTSQTEPGSGAGPGDTSIEAVRAIADKPSYAWSPDGTKLAFIGVLDGPTAELYLYDISTNKIKRVSQDDAQNYWPSWSPDGKYILFFGADSFGTGAGYAMKGVWSANGDGSNVIWLYKATSSGEELVGWRDDQTAILDSWNPSCGSGELRLYNIVTTHKTFLQEGCFSAAAAGNWVGSPSNAVMFSKEDGLYLLPADSDQPVKIADNHAMSIKWDQEGVVFVVTFNDGSMTTIFTDGGNRQNAPVSAQDVAEFGLIWAWTNLGGELPGVWISGPGMDLGQIFKGQAYAPIWNSNNNNLFFFSGADLGTDLYRATFSTYYKDVAPVARLTGNVQGVAWVGNK